MLRTIAAPLPHVRPAILRAGSELTIVDDGQGIGLSLAAALESQGFETTIVSKGSSVKPDTDGVIYLRGLRDFASIEAASEVAKDAFDAARIVAPRFTERGGYFMTVQDTGGRFALDEWCEPTKAVLGALAGLAKTAAQEWPLAVARAIDLDAGHRDFGVLAQELAEEILAGGDEVEIGRPDGERIKIDLQTAAIGKAALPPLGPGDVVVVSGGARGVTAACIVELASRTRGRFALLGRSPLPEVDPLEAELDDAVIKRTLLERAKAAGESVSPKELGAQAAKIAAAREIRQTLAQVASAGGEARYISVDVRDVNELCDAFDGLREQWGPIRGVVHGAGVIEDRRLEDKTDDQFDRVIGTKVSGFWALCAATAQDPLKVLCAFSSVAGRAGNVGQSDYAMANEILNKSAQIEARRREGCVVKSIAWGPWDGGMVGPDLRKVFEQRGIALIGIDAGAQIFADEVLGNSPDVEIVVGSLIEANAVASEPDPASNIIERAVRISTATHPYLRDHEIDGTPVLPLACALELFIETVTTWFDPRDLALTDVRVKHGVRLRKLDEGELLTIRAERSTNGVDQAFLELHDGEGKLCYTATAVAHPAPEAASIVPQTSNEAYEGVVYDGQLLFHGPSLRVLQDVHRPGEQGMTAVTLTSTGAGWAIPHLETDPAALDGAMQLAVLWTSQRIDGLSLPLGVADFRALRPFDADHVTAVLRERSSNRSRTLTDIDLIDPQGELVATFRGVEVYKYRRRD